MYYKLLRKRSKKQYLGVLGALFTVVGLSAFIYVKVAFAATATWTNSGGDNLWSNCSNWSGGTCTPGSGPGSSDVATFNGSTSNANVTIDANANVAGFNFINSYSGT